MRLRFYFPIFSAAIFAVFLVAFIVVNPFFARAAAVSWDGGGDGSTWSDGTNWSGDSVPGAGDDVTISGTATVNITADLGLTLGSLTLGDDSDDGADSTVDVILNFQYDALNAGGVAEPLSITNALTVNGDAQITHTANTTSNTYTINISAGSMTVDADITGAGTDANKGGIIFTDTMGCQGAAGSTGKGPNASNLCANSTAGFGEGANTGNTGSEGAGHGGPGGFGNNYSSNGSTYDSLTAPTLLGSSGGGTSGAAGGHGGGLIRLDISGTLLLNGDLTADASVGGSTTNQGAGGGSGGSIYVTTATINGSGSFSVDGAAGGNNGGFDGGGGGGGRIAVVYTDSGSAFTFSSSSLTAAAGAAGAGNAEAGGKGTVYINDTTASTVEVFHGFYFDDTDYSETTWTFDSSIVGVCESGAANPSVEATGTLTLAGTITCSSASLTSFNFIAGTALSVASGTTIDLSGSQDGADMDIAMPAGDDVTWTNVTISLPPEGFLTIDDAVDIELAGTTALNANTQFTNLTEFILGSSASISTNALGCQGVANSDGYGPDGSNVCTLATAGYGDGGGAFTGGQGAGHGGAGGNGTLSGAGGTYDTNTAPVLLGSSGGGSSARPGGHGGGLIRISATTVTSSGTYSANGGDGSTSTNQSSGGGSGGSVYISATGTLTMESSTITTTGGAGQISSGFNSGSGGGGMVRIDYVVSGSAATTTHLGTLANTVVAAKGTGGANNGSDGTLSIQQSLVFSSATTSVSSGTTVDTLTVVFNQAITITDAGGAGDGLDVITLSDGNCSIDNGTYAESGAGSDTLVLNLTCSGASANDTSITIDPTYTTAGSSTIVDDATTTEMTNASTVTGVDGAAPLFLSAVTGNSPQAPNVNQLVITFSESVTVTDGGTDNDVTLAASTGTASIDAGSYGTTATSLTYTVTASTSNNTSLTIDPTYASAGAGDITDANGNEMANGETVTGTDGAEPYPIKVAYSDSDTNRTVDRVDVIFSESLNAGSFSYNTTDWSFTEASELNLDDTGASLVTTIVSNDTVRLTVSADANETGHTTTPTLQYTNNAARVQDTNSQQTETWGSAENVSDEASPMPLTTTYYDATSSDGKLDLITMVLTEPIVAVVDGSADWAISSASNFSSLVEGTVECNSGSAAANECDYNFTTATIKTDTGDLTLDYTAGSSVADAAGNTGMNFNISGGQFTDGAAPAAIDSLISIAGGSGTSGAYIVGDVITATWDNSSTAGDVSSVTADLSGWGGSATATMTDTTTCGGTASDNIYEACYTILGSEGIDATGRNVSVSATDAASNNRVGSDTTGATVDTIVPTLSAGNITVTGCSGTAGACINGDTAVPTWNNTAGGDNNSDTIASVAFNVSSFRAADTALAGSEASGTWTGTLSGALDSQDDTGNTITATVTDNAGNVSGPTASSTSYTIDTIVPVVTTSNISVAGFTGTAGAFKNGDTAVPTWNNTAGGDNNTDTIASVSFNAGDFRTGDTSLTGSNASGTWTASLSGALTSQDDTSNNITVTATDNAGNVTATVGTNNYIVDTIAPTLSAGNITVTGCSGTAGACRSGDVAVARWDNSGTGDNNSDTISTVIIDASSFDSGSGSIAGSESAGIFTSTIGTLDSQDDTGNTINVTAIDNAGNSVGPTTSTASYTIDTIVPTLSSNVYQDANADGTVDQVLLTFSEDVSNGFAADKDEWTFPEASELTLVAPAADLNVTNSTTMVTLVVGADADETGHTTTPTLSYTNTAGILQDDVGNAVANFVGQSVSDGAAPLGNFAQFQDNDADGTLELVSISYTEDISAVVDGSADWAISSSSDFASLVEGTVECNSGSAASDECLYNFTTSTVKTDVGDLTLTYTAGSSVTDGTNNAVGITYNSGNLVDGAAPEAIDVQISIAGGTGTSGAYKIGDVITVTWDASNTSDVNTVTADLSGWGGSATATMTDTTACSGTASDNIYEACYTILGSEGIDATSVNASVNATDTASNNRIGSDTTGATVDTIVPTLTAGNLTVTGATGTSGAFKNGDAPVLTWDNTVSGDNNTDTIASISFDGSTFKTGDIARAGSNTSETWTASLSGSMDSQDDTGNTIAATVTDNAGNTSGPTASTASYTIDTIVPTVTAGSLSVTGDSGTSGAFKSGDTQTYIWNPTTSGESDTIVTVAFDGSSFKSTDTGVSATLATNWTVTSTLDSQDDTGNTITATVTDNVGNVTTSSASTASYTVDTIVPTVTAGNVTVTGCSGTGGACTATDTLTLNWLGDTDGETDTISNVTFVATDFDTASTAVSGSDPGTPGTNNWTGALTDGSPDASQDDTGNQITVTVIDNAGNATGPITSTATYIVDNVVPTLSGAVYQDANTDGTVDQVLLTFSEDISNGFAADKDEWTFPEASELTLVAPAADLNVTNSTTTVTLVVGADADETGHTTTPTLSYTNTAGTLQDDAGNPVANFVGQSLTDNASPVVISRTTNDDDANGQIDQITVTYTEDLNGSSVAGIDYTVSGYTVDSALESSVAIVTVTLNESGSADTDATPGVTSGAGIRDLWSNDAILSTVSATDGADPAILSRTYLDDSTDGSVDRLSIVFSESVTHNGSDLDQWGVTANDLTGLGDPTALTSGSGTTTLVYTIPTTTNRTGTYNGETEPTLQYTQSATPANRIQDSVSNELASEGSATSILDGAAPRVYTVYTVDNDANGQIDRVVGTFTEHVTSLSTLDFEVDGSVGTGSSAGGDPYTITVDFTESGSSDTDRTPTLEMVTAGFQDDAISPNSNDNHSIVVSDQAPPVMTSASPTSGGNHIPAVNDFTITFSEPIDTAAFALSESPSLVAGSFSYAWDGTDETVTVSPGTYNMGRTVTHTITAPDVPGNAYGGTTYEIYPLMPSSSGGGGGGGAANVGNTVTVVSDAVSLVSPSTPITTGSLSGQTSASMRGGDAYDIVWTTSGNINNVNLYYSVDGGATYATIVSGTDNDGSYSWTVPNIATTNGYIKIVGRDAGAATLATDSSEAPYTISVNAILPLDGAPETDESSSTSGAMDIVSNVPIVEVTLVDGKTMMLKSGHLFRGETLTGVYLVDQDGKRRVFPSESVYFSYYDDFDDVVMVLDDQLQKLSIGRRVTMASGRMVKIQSNPNVYQVHDGGLLRLVPDEATAISLYGDAWNTLITDIAPTFWGDYTLSADLESVGE